MSTFSVEASLLRTEKGQDYNYVLNVFSRIIQQYFYAPFNYKQLKWNIDMLIPFQDAKAILTYQDNRAGADQFDITIKKDLKMAFKANLLTTKVPSIEVESSYIVHLFKQLLAFLR